MSLNWEIPTLPLMYNESAASAGLEVMPASKMAPVKISFVFIGDML